MTNANIQQRCTRRFGRVIQLFLLAAFLLIAQTVATAQLQVSPHMQQGLVDLQIGNYAKALTSFQQAVRAQPGNVQARYCLAVCYQHLGRYSDATNEYSWVVKNADPALARRAQKGLDGCAGMRVATGGAQSYAPTAAPNEGTTGGEPQTGAPPIAPPFGRPPVAQPGFGSIPGTAATAPPEGGAGQYSGAPAGTPKIVDVYTDWCGWCKRFEPTFNQAQAKFGSRIDFERINAEAPGNKELTQSWGVRGFPTIVFFDGSGKIVDIVRGCPKSYEIFEDRIVKAFPTEAK
jgi:thioredoxin-like negative regulator of GroEL